MQVPHTFTPGTVISSSEVNENFELFEDALDKTGDDMTGDLGTEHVIPVTNNTYNLGSTIRRFANVFTYGVQLVDSDASHHLRIINGSNLTADRTFTILPGDMDITLEFPLPMALGGLGVALTDPDADRILFWDDSAGAFTWLEVGSGLTITDTTLSGSGGSGLTIAGATDHSVIRADGATNIQDSGVIIDDTDNVSGVVDLDATGDVTIGGDLTVTGDFSAAANVAYPVGTTFVAAAGNNNNMAVGTGMAFLVNTSAGPASLTGIAGGYDGRVVGLINAGTSTYTVSGQNTNSTAANRFAASSTTVGSGNGVWFIYIGSTQRWYFLGGSA